MWMLRNWWQLFNQDFWKRVLAFGPALQWILDVQDLTYDAYVSAAFDVEAHALSERGVVRLGKELSTYEGAFLRPTW